MRVRFGMEWLGLPARFWTLTIPGRIKTASYAYEILPSMWESVRKAMQRKAYPAAWHYCAFVEGQPLRGDMPHFHIITFDRYPLKFTRFKDFAVAHGFGYQAKDESVSSSKGAVYVAKYASKSLFEAPAHFRRVRLNQEWPADDKFEPYIVKRWNETTADFILRAALKTRHEIQELYDRWEHGHELLEVLRDQNDAARAVDEVYNALYDVG
jgi:hypothetical protein